MSETNDLKEIKSRILEENQVEKLLIKMGCKNISLKANRYEAQLPDRFNHKNDRAVQIKLNESLSSKIYNVGVTEIDIYGLVSYIEFNCLTKEEQQRNLSQAKGWICKQLDYHYSYSNVQEGFEEENPLDWLKDFRKSRKKKKDYVPEENKTYDQSILEQYIMNPLKHYIEEGIDYQTQIDFEIGVDLKTNRIIFPIHNQFGEIVSIKGRTLNKDHKAKKIPKFMYLYNFNKINEMYNWHRAVYYIMEKKEVIIYESEKSCWLTTQWGYRNCIGIGGSDLTDFQVKMIKDLGNNITIIIALDKDKNKEEFIKQGKKFGLTRNVYALWDNNDLLSKENKDSPVDKGKDVFEKLYADSKNYKI